MKRFRRQLVWGVAGLAAASAAALWLNAHFGRALPDYGFLTGWILLAAILVLTFYNARKKLPFLPLGNSEAWLQIHIYLGFLTVLLFVIHLNFRLPRGGFEIALAWLFVLVAGSGMVGLLFSRVLPRRLATRGGEVIYEAIPALRHSLRTEAEKLAAGPEATSPVIAEFYARRLSGFFGGRGNGWLHLAESRRRLNALLAEIEDVRRTGNEAERATLERLALLVRQKDSLDYHRSLQLALKLWLFVHIPLTYGLLVFIALHIVLVFGFSGGAR